MTSSGIIRDGDTRLRYFQLGCTLHSADANESRDWRIHADFAKTLIAIARPLYRCWRQL